MQHQHHAKNGYIEMSTDIQTKVALSISSMSRRFRAIIKSNGCRTKY